MNSPMIWRATPVSMSSSSGSTYGAPAGAASVCQERSSVGVSDRGSMPALLAQHALELPQDELRPLVTQQRQCHAFATNVVEVDLSDVQPLLQQRRREAHLPGRIDDLRATPERDCLVDTDAVDEHDVARGQLGVGAHQRPP